MAQLLDQMYAEHFVCSVSSCSEEITNFPQKYSNLLTNGSFLEAANLLEHTYHKVTQTQLKSIEALKPHISRYAFWSVARFLFSLLEL